VREAGGEPVLGVGAPGRPEGGGALAREWIADSAHISCAGWGPDALLVCYRDAEELAGLLLAALRLNLPTVFVPLGERLLDAVCCALGLAPLARDPAEVAVALARDGGPCARDLANSFSLANALRTGLAAGGGPGLLVHLAAIARESGVPGFVHMIRVLAPESPELVSPAAPKAADLLSCIKDTLHDVRTVEGQLTQTLPSPVARELQRGNSLSIVAGRSSGVEAVASAPTGASEVAGVCRVFDSEREAVEAIEAGRVVATELIVVRGCGPRGGPGLLRLDALARVLDERGPAQGIPVITDGLPPPGARGTWVSLFSPEAAAGGVIGRLRDGDDLRIDLREARIRTRMPARELEARDPYRASSPRGADYAARYARTALSALQGAGFG
jgi:dihydroxy-acid dehydratase